MLSIRVSPLLQTAGPAEELLGFPEVRNESIETHGRASLVTSFEKHGRMRKTLLEASGRKAESRKSSGSECGWLLSTSLDRHVIQMLATMRIRARCNKLALTQMHGNWEGCAVSRSAYTAAYWVMLACNMMTGCLVPGIFESRTKFSATFATLQRLHTGGRAERMQTRPGAHARRWKSWLVHRSDTSDVGEWAHHCADSPFAFRTLTVCFLIRFQQYSRLCA
jgi:hypothetical protein